MKRTRGSGCRSWSELPSPGRVSFQVPVASARGGTQGQAAWGGSQFPPPPQNTARDQPRPQELRINMNNLKGRKSGKRLQKALCCFFSLSTFFLALSPVTYPVTPFRLSEDQFLYLGLLQAVSALGGCSGRKIWHLPDAAGSRGHQEFDTCSCNKPVREQPVPILRMRKPRLREGDRLARHHTVNE